MHRLQLFYRSLTLAGLLCALFVLIWTPTASAAAQANLKAAADCPQPPAGVDLSTLTPTALSYYGLPRQLPTEDHAHWANLLSHAHHRNCTVTTSHVMHSHPAPGTPHTYDATSANWGGQVAFSSAGWPITYAASRWSVPGIPPSSPDGDSATWVGIGGFGNNNLVQTGTEQEIGTFLWWRTYTYRAWVENLADPSNPYARFVFDVKNTDSIAAEVNNNYMFIDDIGSGNYSGQTFGPNPDPGTADYIVERSGNTPLADFQSVTLTYCSYSSTVGGKSHYWNLGNVPPLKNIIVNSANTPLVSVGNIDPNTAGFSVIWLRSS